MATIGARRPELLQSLTATIRLVRLLVAAAAMGLIWLASDIVLNWLALPSTLRFLLAAAVGTGALFSLHATATTQLQCIGKYTAMAFILPLPNILRLIFLLPFAARPTDIHTVGTAYFISTVIGVALASAIGSRLTHKHHAQVSVDFDTWRELFRFAAPLALVNILIVASDRTDLLILSALRELSEVGLYGVAQQLTAVIPLLSSAVLSALIPRVLRTEGKAQLQSFYGTVLRLFPVLVLLALAAAVLAAVVTRAFVPDATSISTVIGVLVLALVIYSAFHPLNLILFRLRLSKLSLIVEAGHLIVVISAAFLLVPHFGAIGAALGNLLGRVSSVLAMLLLVHKVLNSGKPVAQ
jgi:O-antigen/teichoic acid export membrane protein